MAQGVTYICEGSIADSPAEKRIIERKSLHQGFKLGEGRSKSHGSDPVEGEVSPNQGPGGQACLKAEPAQTHKRADVDIHSKL